MQIKTTRSCFPPKTQGTSSYYLKLEINIKGDTKKKYSCINECIATQSAMM